MNDLFILLLHIVIIPLAANGIIKTNWIEVAKYRMFYWIYSKKTPYRPYSIKPFDCELCLAFHLSWIQMVVFHQWKPEFSLLPLASCMVSYLIAKIGNY